MQQHILKFAEQLGQALKKAQFKLVTAESCTGGGLSYYITSIPGSSEWFDRGFITYQDSAKIQMLGVHPLTLTKFGAVSEPVVQEMAIQALKNSTAAFSIAITGIAGPTGGSTEKPVGTVWVAWASALFPVCSQHFCFKGNRLEIREQAIIWALTNALHLLQSPVQL